MKNFRLFRFKAQFLVIAAAVLTLCGCPEDKEPDTLAADLSKVTFSADDTAEKSITVTSNTTWASSRSDSWIETRQSDNKLYIKVENYANTSNSRTGTITLTAGDALPVTITVEQDKKELNSLSVTPNSLIFLPNESGAKTVSVTTNSKDGWNATSDKSWITLTKKDNTIEVKVGTNSSNSERTGTIKVTAGNAPEKTITVTQGFAITFTVSPEKLEFDYKAGSKNITVNTNASDWTYSENASWISVTKSSNRLAVSVTENTGKSERTANIKITAGGEESTVSVKQDGAQPDIYINTSDDLSFGSDQTSEQYIQVSTNASTWSASTPVSWLTLTKSGQTLRVRAAANNNSARSATITFNADNGKATASVKVSQASGLDPLPPEFATYRGSGTPKILQTPGPSTWTGIWLLNRGLRYSLTGWGGKSITSYMNYNSSTKKFTIEHNTSVITDASNSQIKGYFVALIVENNKILVIKDYPISYNSNTKTIDFSGKVNGIDVWVGIIGVNGAMGDTFNFAGVAFAECYANAKIVFDSYSNAPQMNNNTDTRSLKISGEKIKIDTKTIKSIEVKSIHDF